MIPPGQALRFFGFAFLAGAALGIYYGFLTPLRRGHPILCDLAFVLGTGWVLVLLAFRLCGGDLRPACLVALALGFFWEQQGLNGALRPIFETFL